MLSAFFILAVITILRVGEGKLSCDTKTTTASYPSICPILHKNCSALTIFYTPSSSCYVNYVWTRTCQIFYNCKLLSLEVPPSSSSTKSSHVSSSNTTNHSSSNTHLVTANVSTNKTVILQSTVFKSSSVNINIVILSTSVGVSCILILILLAILFWLKKKNNNKIESSDSDLDKTSNTYDDIEMYDMSMSLKNPRIFKPQEMRPLPKIIAKPTTKIKFLYPPRYG